jgi:hypothetical protein
LQQAGQEVGVQFQCRIVRFQLIETNTTFQLATADAGCHHLTQLWLDDAQFFG